LIKKFDFSKPGFFIHLVKSKLSILFPVKDIFHILPKE